MRKNTPLAAFRYAKAYSWKILDRIISLINLGSFFPDSKDFITGEKIQQLCNIYLGESTDFLFNPLIAPQTDKQIILSSIVSDLNNARLVFCYSHRLKELEQKIHYFQNPFVLVSHNSDENIDERYLPLLNHPKIIHWFAQNVALKHPNLTPLPIGIANRQWKHGDPAHWSFSDNRPTYEKYGIYFGYMTIATNSPKRLDCFHTLKAQGIHMALPIPHRFYIREMSHYRYSICPEGNGLDTHRFWESLYCNVIPITLRNAHTELWAEQYPVILLDRWSDLDVNELANGSYCHLPFNETTKQRLTFEYYRSMIEATLKC